MSGMSEVLAVVGRQPTDYFNPREQRMYAEDTRPYENLETPERELLIRSMLNRHFPVVLSEEQPIERLSVLYGDGYLDFLMNPPGERLFHRSECNGFLQDSDEYVWLDRNTFRAAKTAADVAMIASQRALLDGNMHTYGLCRPPGHHSGMNKMGGFCYLNNTALAALMLREMGKTVGILDFDRHAGNGTHDSVLGKDGIYFSSMHVATTYPWYCTENDFYNRSGDNVMVFPLGEDDRSSDFFGQYSHALDFLTGKNVDLILVSLGLDSSIHDVELLEEVGTFGLTREDFYKAGEELAKTGKRTVTLQEGGYNPEFLAQNLKFFLDGIKAGS